MHNLSFIGAEPCERVYAENVINLRVTNASIVETPAGQAIVAGVPTVLWTQPIIFRANAHGGKPLTPTVMERYGMTTPDRIKTCVAGVVIELRDPRKLANVLYAADDWASVGVVPTILIAPTKAAVKFEDDTLYGIKTALKLDKVPTEEDLYIPEPMGMSRSHPTDLYVRYVRHELDSEDIVAFVNPKDRLDSLYAGAIRTCRDRMIEAGIIGSQKIATAPASPTLNSLIGSNS